jgi:hypothetical protein
LSDDDVEDVCSLSYSKKYKEPNELNSIFLKLNKENVKSFLGHAIAKSLIKSYLDECY